MKRNEFSANFGNILRIREISEFLLSRLSGVFRLPNSLNFLPSEFGLPWTGGRGLESWSPGPGPVTRLIFVESIVDTVDFPNSETLNFLENNLEIKFLSRVSSRPNSENFLPPKAPILVINANAEPHGKPISLSRPCFETHSDMIGIMCD